MAIVTIRSDRTVVDIECDARAGAEQASIATTSALQMPDARLIEASNRQWFLLSDTSANSSVFNALTTLPAQIAAASSTSVTS